MPEEAFSPRLPWGWLYNDQGTGRSFKRLDGVTVSLTATADLQEPPAWRMTTGVPLGLAVDIKLGAGRGALSVLEEVDARWPLPPWWQELDAGARADSAAG